MQCQTMKKGEKERNFAHWRLRTQYEVVAVRFLPVAAEKLGAIGAVGDKASVLFRDLG